MYTEQFFIDGLACASYLIACDAVGEAVVVDPDRDVRKYLEAARSRGVRITRIIETHLHADHVSGDTELAARTGAQIYIHEASGAEFEHRSLRDGDFIEFGDVRLHVLHTPGHTPESITLLIADTTRSSEPWLALTGDTLFVGDIGRPDLVGAEAARGLAQNLHESLFGRLLPLSDSLLLYPGHGAGSLCGKSIGAMRSTTLGFERRNNPALAPRGQSDFVTFATGDLPEQPGNHIRIKAMNRKGPKVLGTIEPQPLSIDEAIGHLQGGAAVLDTRPKEAYVRAHIPGSVHLEADAQLSNRAGFVLPPNAPVLLLLRDPSDYEQVVYSLARIGFDEGIGYLGEDLHAWEARGLPLASGDVQNIEPAELHRLRQGEMGGVLVVDVREPWEFQRGHVPEARLIPLAQLAARLVDLDAEQPVALICATGNRSQSAAALLAQKGFKIVYNVLGGTKAWKQQGFEISQAPPT